MIGKASITRTKLAESYYAYDHSTGKRSFIRLDQAINEALEKLGDVSVIDIRYNSQVYSDHVGDFHQNDTALIIYRTAV